MPAKQPEPVPAATEPTPEAEPVEAREPKAKPSRREDAPVKPVKPPVKRKGSSGPRFTADEVAVDEEAKRLTVRVPVPIFKAFYLASMERKIRREAPFNQQDIVVEALSTWLGEQGYLGDN
jgi:hypothetical protein